jgi:hypothetical protein
MIILVTLMINRFICSISTFYVLSLIMFRGAVSILLPVNYTGVVAYNPGRLIRASFKFVKDYVNVFIRIIFIYIYIFGFWLTTLHD